MKPIYERMLAAVEGMRGRADDCGRLASQVREWAGELMPPGGALHVTIDNTNYLRRIGTYFLTVADQVDAGEMHRSSGGISLWPEKDGGTRITSDIVFASGTKPMVVHYIDASRCTCPSGDGSLRWPCPVHPPMESLGREACKPEFPIPKVPGCGIALAPGQHFSHCGETDMGQTLGALCEECGGSFKRAQLPPQ